MLTSNTRTILPLALCAGTILAVAILTLTRFSITHCRATSICSQPTTDRPPSKCFCVAFTFSNRELASLMWAALQS
uniref:Putative secreted protein n=1 Tax=Anopheles darlingi TaxID=43151 RepID=A0A2M4D897_ANODA